MKVNKAVSEEGPVALVLTVITIGHAHVFSKTVEGGLEVYEALPHRRTRAALRRRGLRARTACVQAGTVEVF